VIYVTQERVRQYMTRDGYMAATRPHRRET
jgi:hypothetical protein